jgi:hypothetical protein
MINNIKFTGKRLVMILELARSQNHKLNEQSVSRLQYLLLLHALNRN